MFDPTQIEKLLRSAIAQKKIKKPKGDPNYIQRGTYTEQNAKRWIEIIESAMVKDEDTFVPSSAKSPTTLYMQLNDSIKWMIDHGPNNTREIYSLLRAMIKFTKVECGEVRGVLIAKKVNKIKMLENQLDNSNPSVVGPITMIAKAAAKKEQSAPSPSIIEVPNNTATVTVIQDLPQRVHMPKIKDQDMLALNEAEHAKVQQYWRVKLFEWAEHSAPGDKFVYPKEPSDPKPNLTSGDIEYINMFVEPLEVEGVTIDKDLIEIER